MYGIADKIQGPEFLHLNAKGVSNLWNGLLHVRDTAGTQVLVKFNKMSSVLVRCYCQVCHGKSVSRYVRRRHVEMYVDRVSAPPPKKVAYDLMPLCHGTP